ncbi:MAG: cyclodeaminase/cyclohydrolase family protein, partial [Candidatus Eisenbacteria bacterium]
LEIRMEHPPVSEGVTLGGFLDEVASATPTPGGGTVAALAGALGAALVSMVAGLTRGKKKYAAVEPEMADAQREAQALRARLVALMRQDAQAFDAVLGAMRLPQATPAEAAARQGAIEAATWTAARVPLETAEACLAVSRWAARMVRSGNVNAASDGLVAAALGRAACEGALCNVEINLQSLPDSADKQAVTGRVHDLARHAEEALTEARTAFRIATERTA